MLAIELHAGHRHDLLFGHLILEQGAVDHGVANAGVNHRHHVQRLHHIRAVMAGERNVGFKMKACRQRLDLLDQLGVKLGRITADLQQRQHQRSEFMAKRDAGKAHSAIATTHTVNGKRWLALAGGVIFAH